MIQEHTQNCVGILNPYKENVQLPARRRKPKNRPVVTQLNKYDSNLLRELSQMHDSMGVNSPAQKRTRSAIDDIPLAKLSPCVREILSEHFKASNLQKWRKKKEKEVEKIIMMNKKWRLMKRRKKGRRFDKLKVAAKVALGAPKKKPSLRNEPVLFQTNKKVKFVRRRRKKYEKKKKNILRKSMSQNDIAKLKSKDRKVYLQSRGRINGGQSKKLRRVNSAIIRRGPSKNRRARSTKPVPSSREPLMGHERRQCRRRKRYDFSCYFQPKVVVPDEDDKRKKKCWGKGDASGGNLACLKNMCKQNKEPNVDTNVKFPKIGLIPSGL